MVRTYKKTSGRQQWSQESLQKALATIKREGTSTKRTAEDYGIPRQTLARYLQQEAAEGLPEAEAKKIGSFKTVFSPNEERELVSHILKLEVRCYGITTREIRSLAYQLAIRNGKTHCFNSEKQLAGWDWLHGFRKRHPELALRSPEATSAARLQGFNKVAVDHFFEVLSRELEGGKFSPSRIFNVDETSVVTVSCLVKLPQVDDCYSSILYAF
jgi:transposase-like protein